ncbi:MAG: hypothetical protein K2I22_05340 [Lachnospiraceae bacterium]|nr:hypothetical protein [Lachnospiraceae bacterium]
MGRKQVLYGGGYKEISKYPLELKRKKWLLSYNDLYYLCVNKQKNQIEKEIIEIEEKIGYLESKGNDVEIV